MEQIRKLEVALAGVYKKAPHLPEKGQKWLTDNIWWLVLVGVFMSVISVISIVSLLFFALFGLGAEMMVGSGGSRTTVASLINGVTLFIACMSLVLYVVEIVLFIIATSPLKSFKKRGWNILFVVAMISATVNIITSIVAIEPVTFALGLLLAIIGLYFLFEIRDRFVEQPTVKNSTMRSKKQQV